MSENPSLRELQKISKILLLVNATKIEQELSKIATTPERKAMWVLMNGKLMPKDIAAQAGSTTASVSRFLNAAIAAGLLEYNKGEPPRRILDYVPPEWVELLKLETEEDSNSQVQTKIDLSIKEEPK
jgi:hypothetical protein